MFEQNVFLQAVSIICLIVMSAVFLTSFSQSLMKKLDTDFTDQDKIFFIILILGFLRGAF